MKNALLLLNRFIDEILKRGSFLPLFVFIACTFTNNAQVLDWSTYYGKGGHIRGMVTEYTGFFFSKIFVPDGGPRFIGYNLAINLGPHRSPTFSNKVIRLKYFYNVFFTKVIRLNGVEF
jgi:hypothetical protein